MIRAAFGMLLGLTLGCALAVASTPSFRVEISSTASPIADPRPTLGPSDLLLLSGKATHYDAERNGESAWYTREGISFYGAAGPRMRALIPHKWRGEYLVIVSSERTGRAVVVHVVDFCECRGGDTDPANDRLIDLAPAVWEALGVPLKLGVTAVRIELLSSP